MCMHSEEEVRRYLHRSRKNPDRSVVIMREPGTLKFQEAYHCLAHDVQDIANTIRNLRAWHPEEHVVDLTQLNAKRQWLNDTKQSYRRYFAEGRYPIALTEADLPRAQGRAPKSEDDYTVRADDVVDPVLKALEIKPVEAPVRQMVHA